jgi:hypothetical protein
MRFRLADEHRSAAATAIKYFTGGGSAGFIAVQSCGEIFNPKFRCCYTNTFRPKEALF